MRKNQRNFLVLVAVVMVMICVFAALKLYSNDNSTATGPLTPVEETQPQEPTKKVEEPVKKVYVNVFFIGHNGAKEEVYRAVKREYDKNIDGSKIKFAIKALVAGPLNKERNRGVYSEIPSTTAVIAIQETSDKVIINLSSDFGQGGADSLYKRVYQLIKTARNNSSKPVYLYLDGQKADVLGGDGLMLTQPLNENSLNN